MKNTVKLAGIVILALIIGFSFIACSDTGKGGINAKAPDVISHFHDATYTQYTTSVAPLHVAAESSDGGTLTYQWYRNSANSTANGTAIDGAESDTYTPPTTDLGTLYYYVVVTNTIANNGDGGKKTATKASDIARITVDNKENAQRPIISSQPQNATFKVGTVAHDLSVTAIVTEGTLTYQWFSNNKPSNENGTNLGPDNGAQTESFTPSTANIGIFYYYVEVTNTIDDNGDGGIKSIKEVSDFAIITINDKDNAQVPVITIHPLDAIYNHNELAVDLTVTVSVSDGGELTYE